MRLLQTLLLAALLAAPMPVAGHDARLAVAAAPGASADLAPALGADGTFHGAPGLAGTIDGSAWTLVSDIAAGEPPRFALAASAIVAPGPWSALGGGALNNYVYALAVSGSDVYVGGFFQNAAGIPEADYVARWNGSTWSSLGGTGDGALNGIVRALAVSGGDLYVGGDFQNAAGIAEADYVARWNGSAWSALGSTGPGLGALFNGVQALAVSGNVLYAGGFFHNAAGIPEADYVARWNGSTWSSLGGTGDGALNGIVRALAVSGGDLYVGGDFQNAAGIAEADYVARWNGSTWSALGGAGGGALNDVVNALAVSGSDVYVGGYFLNAAGIAEADHVARWNGSAWSALGSNGTGDGALNKAVYALAVSGSGLYVGGYFLNAAGIAEADFVARWNGSSWSALGSNGAGDGAINDPIFDGVFALAVSGSDLYVGGVFDNAAGIVAADNVARWNGIAWSALGSAGPGVGALNNRVHALAVSGSGLYVGGFFQNAAGIAAADFVARWTLGRPVATAADFNGDGSSDIAIYRPSQGRWYINGQGSAAFGMNGDIPVPADYTGDGIVDLAVFRPSEGRWYVNGLASTAFGTNGDIPVPADYTGNGTADIAVFRPSEGRWYINGLASIPFGTSGDIPLPADYDGDGIVDLAVFRPSEGRWYINGQGNGRFGTNGDIPMPADYTGDGIVDLAVFRPSEGRWYVNGLVSFGFGTNGDIPVPADYNANGNADIAIYRPGEGRWYISGQGNTQFGLSTDIPVVLPAAVRLRFFP